MSPSNTIERICLVILGAASLLLVVVTLVNGSWLRAAVWACGLLFSVVVLYRDFRGRAGENPAAPE